MMVITTVTQVSRGLLLTLRSKSVFSVDESNVKCISLTDASYWSLGSAWLSLEGMQLCNKRHLVYLQLSFTKIPGFFCVCLIKC